MLKTQISESRDLLCITANLNAFDRVYCKTSRFSDSHFRFIVPETLCVLSQSDPLIILPATRRKWHLPSALLWNSLGCLRCSSFVISSSVMCF
ncbi:hypothetical protein QTP86_017048 [Hemibagrus guttatus]|nr:hypothetical protein QTP86_017048 [Hemibagrus guttatus]